MIIQNPHKRHTYPKQKLSRASKTDKWARECVDWVIQASSSNLYTDYQKIKANYDLYNSIIDEEDFKYVTNPYGVDQNFPARLHNYNIITPKIKLLEGEEIKRPFNFRAVAVNSDAVSELQEKRKQLLMEYLESELLIQLQDQGINIQDPSAMEVMNPAQIEKYMMYSESDIRESTANKLLNYFIKKQNLEFKFNKGFKDALIADKEYYYIGIDGDEPFVEVVNPLDFDYDIDPDLDFIQDGQWARHTKYMTPNQVLDEYHKYLKDSDIQQLDGWGVEGTTGNISNSSINNTAWVNNFKRPTNGNYVPVTRVEWKSMRKIGYLKYYDENLEEQEIIVDETYKVNKEAGETIEWDWISEVWEGTKIGEGIYVKVQPKKVQYRSIDNPSICKLGFVGTTYNSRNSESTSLIDLVKHHQYLYNIIMYRMEMEIAKAKGKKMVMDLAQIPRSEGIDLEQWMYYFDSVGIAFINSFEEGSGNLGAGKASTFNQFTAIDMSLSQAVGQYIGILNKIEEQCETLMGVSRQRQGAISSNETVGGVERAVVQSSNITEPIFYLHNEVKKHVLTHLVETAKIILPASKKINYITDDMTRVFLQISEEFVDADYGVFITNSAKEVKALEDLRAIAQQTAASGLMTLSDLITIVDSNSMADIKATVRESEMKSEQAKQMEQENALQQIEAQAEAERLRQSEDHDRLDNREYIKGGLAIEREQIRALGFAQDQDVNNNNVPDVLELEKLTQQDREHRDKMSLEIAKLDLEKQKMESAERVAKQKAEVDKIKAKRASNNTSKK